VGRARPRAARSSLKPLTTNKKTNLQKHVPGEPTVQQVPTYRRRPTSLPEAAVPSVGRPLPRTSELSQTEGGAKHVLVKAEGFSPLNKTAVERRQPCCRRLCPARAIFACWARKTHPRRSKTAADHSPPRKARSYRSLKTSTRQQSPRNRQSKKTPPAPWKSEPDGSAAPQHHRPSP